MTDRPLHSVSVSGVVLDDQARLLVVQRRATGAWTLPGGVVEHGETLAEAVAREVYEETGVRVQAATLSGVYQNLATHVVSLVFRCRVLGPTSTRASNETSHTAWLDTNDALTRMTDAFAMRVRDALDQTETVVRAITVDDIMAPR